MRDIYQEITDRIIAELENGNIPWHCPWRPPEWRHRNMISGKPYRGINTILLNSSPFDSPFWLTSRQIGKLKGNLKPDATSTLVVFWKFFEDARNVNRIIPMLREYRIYNLEQTYGIPAKHIPMLPPRQMLEFNPIENAEEILAGYSDGPPVIHEGDCACYSPSLDRIKMPSRSKFDSEEEYYSTLFHEEIHSTGHKFRLKRFESGSSTFGSETYSKEELIAEMGAAFLCAYSGIENTTIRNSGAYIRSWLERLKSDKKLVIQAAQKAQKAADFILKPVHTQEQAA